MTFTLRDKYKEKAIYFTPLTHTHTHTCPEFVFDSKGPIIALRMGTKMVPETWTFHNQQTENILLMLLVVK